MFTGHYQLSLVSRSWAKNVPRTYQLFLISWSWGKNIHWMFLLLHKAVEDFFDHIPFMHLSLLGLVEGRLLFRLRFL